MDDLEKNLGDSQKILAEMIDITVDMKIDIWEMRKSLQEFREAVTKACKDMSDEETKKRDAEMHGDDSTEGRM